MSKINPSNEQKIQKHGVATRAWAGLCHGCGICPYANKKPGTKFEMVMRWHRTWCPGWASHTKVYGLKSLT
jgi:Pyruvate/2-oxoacid:ferredoxin oxidoreductase delta subunit